MTGTTTVDLTPIGDRVLVEVEGDKMSAGGLHIPDNARRSATLARGYIVAVGPGRQLENGDVAPMGVNVGDYIMFYLQGGQFAATEVELGSAKYHLVPFGAIVGVFNKGAGVGNPVSRLVS